MRRALLGWVLLLTTATAGPAGADFGEWASGTGNTFLTGLNGLLTAPADPVMSVVSPISDFDDVAAAPVTGRVLGFFQGTLMFLYRSSTGTLDMLFAPIPMVVLSPEPRYTLVPGFEWDGY